MLCEDPACAAAALSTIPYPEWHETLIEAITQKRVISFRLDDSAAYQTAEPHIYGRQGFVPTVLFYHRDRPQGTKAWALVDVRTIAKMQLGYGSFRRRKIPKTFAAGLQTT